MTYCRPDKVANDPRVVDYCLPSVERLQWERFSASYHTCRNTRVCCCVVNPSVVVSRHVQWSQVLVSDVVFTRFGVGAGDCAAVALKRVEDSDEV